MYIAAPERGARARDVLWERGTTPAGGQAQLYTCDTFSFPQAIG